MGYLPAETENVNHPREFTHSELHCSIREGMHTQDESECFTSMARFVRTVVGRLRVHCLAAVPICGRFLQRNVKEPMYFGAKIAKSGVLLSTVDIQA